MKNLTSFVNWCSKNSKQVKTRLKLCKNYVRTLTAILLLILGVGNAWGNETKVVGVTMPANNTYTPFINVCRDNWAVGTWYCHAMTKADLTFEGKQLYIDSYDTSNGWVLVFQFQTYNNDDTDDGNHYTKEMWNWNDDGNNKANHFNKWVWNWDGGSTCSQYQTGSDNSQYSFGTSKLYFDATGWSETNIRVVIGYASMQKYRDMTHVTGTKLYYNNNLDSWNDAMGFGIVGGETGGETRIGDGREYGKWLTDISAHAIEYTGLRHYGLNNNGDNVCYLVVNDGTAGEMPAVSYNTNYLTYLNSTQTFYTVVKEGEGSYTSADSKATISISSYELTSQGTTTQRTPELSTSESSETVTACRTADTRLQIGAVETGYQFDGWWTHPTSGTRKSDLTDYTYNPTAATTLYARFSAKSYTVTLDNEGADIRTGTANVGVIYNATTNLTSAITTPQKTGYTFAGYWTGDNGTGTMLIDASGNWIKDVTNYTDHSGVNPTWVHDGNITLYARWGREFSLVTNLNVLTDETEIVITKTDGTTALSTTQQANNRKAVDINLINSKVIVPDGGPIQVITIEQENSNYRFQVGTDSYLYAIGSSSNYYLQMTSKNAAGDNGVWSITLDGSNQATVIAQGNNDNKNMQAYGTSLFRCSGNGSSDYKVKLYYCTSPYLRITSDDLTAFTYAAGYGPSLAQAVSIKAYNLTGSLTITCPSGYELSSISPISGFSTSNLTLTKDANNKVDATFYIRLAAGKSAGDYDETFSISGGGVAPISIDIEGEVTSAPSGIAYKLLINEDDLFPSDEIVITNEDGSYIMSTTQNSTPAQVGTASGFSLTSTAVFVSSEDIRNIVIEGTDGEWLLKAGDKYLANGANGNKLNTVTLNNATTDGNGLWNISCDNLTGIATAKTTGANTYNWLFSNSSHNFACYADYSNSVNYPKLYAKPSATPNVCGYPSKLIDFEVKAAADKYSDAQSFTVKARNITSGNVTITAPEGWEVSLNNSDYDDEIEITPESNSVAPTTVYARLKSTAEKGEHRDTLIISATGATDRKIALEGTVNPLIVTYNSASDAGDHPTVEVSYNESVEAEYIPDNCAEDRIFIGWSNVAVATQQTEPTTIISADGKIADIVSDTTLYAVFASRNGSGGHDYADDFNDYSTSGSFNDIPKTYGIWKVVYGKASDVTAVTGKMGSKAIVLQKPEGFLATMTTTKKIHNFTGLTSQIATTHNDVFFIIEYSTNGSDWTKLQSSTAHTNPPFLNPRQKQEYTKYIVGEPVDAYVRFEATTSSGYGSSYQMYIDDVTLYSKPHDWVLTDYATSCDKPASVTVTFDKDGGTGDVPASPATGGSITLPTLTKDNYRFDGYSITVNDEEIEDYIYYPGEDFLVNHDVTLTAQWTEFMEEVSGVSGITSGNGISVRPWEVDSIVVNSTTAETPTANVTGTDAALFAVTVDADNKRVDAVAGKTHFPYYVTYTPTAHNAMNEATVSFTCEDVTSNEITVQGRSLPEEFVIAIKKNGLWYALPNNEYSSSAYAKPVRIIVDDEDTPTAAKYAASSTAYKTTNRNASASNMHGLRFLNPLNYWLQVSSAAGTNYTWISTTNSDAQQVWLLQSSDFNVYTLSVPTYGGATDKRLGINNNGNFGFFADNTSGLSSEVYLLPITNKFSPATTEVYEWGEYGVVLAVDYIYGVASASMHIEDGDLVDTIPTGVNGTLGSTKFTRVHHKDFTIGTPANEGKQLYIHWKNSGGTEIGVSQLTIPAVVSSDANLTDLSAAGTWTGNEVHVLPGATLTTDESATFNKLYVYPGATVDVTTGTLTATNLYLRNGWTRVEGTKYDVSRVHIADDAALAKTTAAMYYDIYNSDEGLHYYPLAVPFDVEITGSDSVDYANDFLAYYSRYGYDGQYIIKKYDGQWRANKGPVSSCWDIVNPYETLKPGVGYDITAIPVKGEAIIRFPLNFNNKWTNDGEKGTATIDETEYRKDTVHVVNYTGKATTDPERPNNKGWNLLGVPYMSCFAVGEDMHEDKEAGFIKGHINLATATWVDDDFIYVTVPTHDFSEYIQSHIEDTHLVPGWCFFVQVADEGRITFLTDSIKTTDNLPLLAPRRTAANTPVLKTGVILTDGTKSDKTTLLISDRYSSDYEINADLEKMFGESFTLSTYSINEGVRLAYNAMSTTDALQAIPLGVRIPQDGQYTFALNERYADADIERLDLIDYQEGQITNLMQGAYVFTATQGEDETRFALNVTRKAPEVTTGMESAGAGTDDLHGPHKMLINGILYIVRDGILYDATGKRL